MSKVDVFGDGSYLIGRATANRILRKYEKIVGMAEFYDMEYDLDTMQLSPRRPKPKETWLDRYLSKDSDRQPIDYQGWE